MDKFLARYKWSKHTQDDINNLNSQKSMREVEFIVQNLLKNEL